MPGPHYRRLAKFSCSKLVGHHLLVEAPMASSCRELCWQLAEQGATLTLVQRGNDDLALLCRLLPTPDGQQHQCLTLCVASQDSAAVDPSMQLSGTGRHLCKQLSALPPQQRPHTLLTLPGDGRWSLEDGRACHTLIPQGWGASVRKQILTWLERNASEQATHALELILQSDADFLQPLASVGHVRVRLHSSPMVTGEEDPLLMRLARHQGDHPVKVARQARKLVFHLRLACAPHAPARCWLMTVEGVRRMIGWPRRTLERGAIGFREEKMVLVARLGRWRQARGHDRRVRGGI